jgi:hypothetical protein
MIRQTLLLITSYKGWETYQHNLHGIHYGGELSLALDGYGLEGIYGNR